MTSIPGLTATHRSMREARADQRVRCPLGAIDTIRPPRNPDRGYTGPRWWTGRGGAR